MQFEQQIVAEIENLVTSNYPVWTIGITKDTVLRREEHGSPDIWYEWEVIPVSAAENVERHFVTKGMKVGSSAGVADHIYIFR